MQHLGLLVVHVFIINILSHKILKEHARQITSVSIMMQISDFCNNSALESGQLKFLENIEQSEGTLETFSQIVLNKSSEKNEENTINHWMEIASPILKSGGRPVAVILALGFISIPLMVSGSPWVALTLAVGASLTAIYSCLS